MKRRWILCTAVLVQACAGHMATGGSAADDSLLQRMLIAEDARGTNADGISALLVGTQSPDTTLRRVAVRGLGRMQRASLAPELIRASNDSVPSIRVEAINALAQSLVSLPSGKAMTESSRAAKWYVRSALDDRLKVENTPEVLGALAEAFGRIPVDSVSEVAWAAQRVLAVVDKVHGVDWYQGQVIDYRPRTYHMERLAPPVARGIAKGLYALGRQTSPGLRLPIGADDWEFETRTLLGGGVLYPNDVHVQRLTLLQIRTPFSPRFPPGADIYASKDPEVRRLAIMSGSFRNDSLLNEHDVIVRSAVARLANLSCANTFALLRDSVPGVRLLAIDRLADHCSIEHGADSLAAIASGLGARGIRDFINTLRPPAAALLLDQWKSSASDRRVAWQERVHALVALQKAGAYLTPGLLPAFVADPRRQVREYASRVASSIGNDTVLLRLAADADDNVRASAIGGLSKLKKHTRDSVYLSALESRGFQVILAAANALAGSTDPRASPALLTALDRVTAERRENARDERIALITRIAELGKAGDSSRIRPYLADFDTTIAAHAAAMMSNWTGTTVLAHAKPLSIRPEPLAQIFRTKNLQLRITMADSSGGGTILVRLFTDETPATIARIVRLAKAHYYDGLTFHRIVPNFVIQGGSPGANEQVGDASFMRDEVGTRSHDRGTLGISTRGRDTGDAQFFVNLVDNPRLDHDYTVFGEVISGMDVVDRVLEGDVMARVEIIGGTIQK